MEWLILCLLVPAIVVPVVLLWGFVGCHLVFQAEPDLLPPQNLVATPSSVSEITLTWDNADPHPVRFEIHRATDSGPFELLDTVDNPPFVDPPNSGTPAPLEPGITYNYQVFAILTSDADLKSPGSDVVSARPLAFAADLSVLQQDSAPGVYTFAQRISAAKLHNNGTKVRITVQGSPSDNVVINSIYLSRVAPSGDPYDSLIGAPSLGGLTQVGSAMLLTDDQPKLATPAFVDYTLDKDQDLLIAFDITVTANQRSIRYDPAPGVTSFFGTGVQEAGKPDGDRSSGYTLLPDPRQYLVKQIEVL